MLAMPGADKLTLGTFFKLRKGHIATARECLCIGPDKGLTRMWDSWHQIDDFELEPSVQGASSPGPSSFVSSDSEDDEGPQIDTNAGATAEEELHPALFPQPALQ